MKATLGILREQKAWERRAPLVPRDVKELVGKHGLKIVVQSSTPENSAYPRIFSDDQYRNAGAIIAEDLSECKVIIAVKEIQTSHFLTGKTYVFFSHTIKGQSYNMPMLKRLMEKKCNLIDYETITNEAGQRLIFFGKYAGMAGMINSLWTLGKRLEIEGYHTPLARVKLTHEYANLNDATAAFRQIGRDFISEGIPDDLRPFVIGIAGYGNVSQGAQLILSHFPIEKISAREFLALVGTKENTIYRVIFAEKDTVEPVDSNHKFDLNDFFTHPKKYKSQFAKYVPNLTMLINSIYWTEEYPRLMTLNELKGFYDCHQNEKNRLKVIGDISCDIEGAIQATRKMTKPDNPVYVYNSEDGSITDSFAGHGPAIMAVDNLPCQLPIEASENFSSKLREFIPAIVSTDYTATFDRVNLPSEIKRALFVYKGRLTPKYRFMKKFL